MFSYDGRFLVRIDSLACRGLTVAENHLVRLLESPDEHADEPGDVLIYDARGLVDHFRIVGLADPHDVLWDGSSLVVVSSLNNSILWVTPLGDVLRVWRAPGDSDSWHLNGVYLHENRLIACAFGRYQAFREWSERMAEGEGIVFDVETNEDVITGLSCPHHPRFFDGCWAVCDSTTGSVLRVDPTTKNLLSRTQLAGWTRGLAITDDFVFVGESVMRHDPHPDRNASIAVLDRGTWELVNRLPLPCKAVYDLLVVSEATASGVHRASQGQVSSATRRLRHVLAGVMHVDLPSRLRRAGRRIGSRGTSQKDDPAPTPPQSASFDACFARLREPKKRGTVAYGRNAELLIHRLSQLGIRPWRQAPLRRAGRAP